MLEQLAQQVAMNVAQQLAGEIINNPEKAIAGLTQLGEALFSGHHHTASDVAQDALDAWEVGELSDEAAMQVVAVIINDRKRTRPVTVNAR